MIHIRKTSHSRLPWRLFADETDGRCLMIPHASCRLRREAVALQARLEAVADWERMGHWSEAVRAAVLDVLGTTESAQMDREALSVRAQEQVPRR